MNRPSPIAAALLALCATPLSFAQQTAAAAPVHVAAALPPVVVEGESDKPDFQSDKTSLNKLGDLKDVPQSVTVINKALMQSQGAASLSDALRNVPGITLGGAEGGQIGNNINLNGFTARTDLYLDGFRDRGQYYRDTFALDAVEVLMGPSSMLFGRGSTGGVINQVTKKPLLKSMTEASTSVTSNGLVRATVDANRPLSDTSAWRIAAMAQQGDPSTRDHLAVKDVGIAPSLKLGIDTPTTITLSALLQHNDDQPDYGIPPLLGHPAAVDRDSSVYGFSDDRTRQDIASFTAVVDHRLTPTTSLHNQTQYNSVRTDARTTAPNTIGTVSASGFAALTTATSSLPLDQLWVRQQSHDRVIHDTTLSNQTELTAEVQTGSVAHSLLAGIELGHDRYDNQNSYRNGSCNGVALNPATGTSGYVACTPLVAPPMTASPGDVTSVNGNLATGSATTVAAYVNDTATLTKEFKLVGGLRYDHYDARISNSINASNTKGNTTLGDASQTVSHTSVRAGGIWQPDAVQTYYLSYSSSFNPSLEQLTSTTGLTQPLPPQENRAYELGSKWNLADGKLSLDSALFQIKQTNARSQNADNTYTADGSIRVRGLRLGAAGQLAPRWQIFGGYTLLDAEIVDGIAANTTGKVPTNTARNNGTLWLTYDASSRWQLGGGAVAMSKRYANNTNLVEVGGYTRWDAMLAYRQPSYDVRLNLFNLFDKNYGESLIQSDGGRTVPGTGRTAMVSLNWRM